jgi:hypothetical protein
MKVKQKFATLEEQIMKKKFKIACECGCEWEVFNNTGRAICPACNTRPDGEPEVWDGNVWFGPLNGN